MAESVKKRPGALWATDADVEKPRLSMGTALGIAAILVVLIGFALSQIDLDKALEEAKTITRAVIIEDKPPPPPPPPPKPPEPEKVQKIVKRNIPVDTPPPPGPVPDSPPPAIPVAENPSPTAPAIGPPGASGPAVAAPAPAPAQTGPVAVGVACPNQPRPEIPPRVMRSGNFQAEAVVKVHARIKGGQVTDVEVVSYTGQSEFRQDFRRAVESIVKRYTCENTAQEVVAEQEFVFRPN
ncbi:hypothetical protein BH10PSE17_BH10PSE17_17460 [soil metagenome]